MNKNPLANMNISQYVETNEWSWEYPIPKEGIPTTLSLEDLQSTISEYFSKKRT